MHRRKAPTPWCLAICCILVLGMVAPGALADHTIQIGVVIHLADELTGHWAQGRADEVTVQLVDQLAGRLNDEYPHWSFSPGVDPASPVAVAVIVTAGGSNEMLLEAELRLRHPGHNDTVFELGETVLYKPGHFDAFGRPTPAEAKKDVWSRLETLLELRRKASLETLAERVPLARNPSPIHVPDRTVVLPLPKDRYEHLAWSTFRLHCPGQQPAELLSTAHNEWGLYDPDIPIALKVIVENNIPGPQLQGLRPVLVYLKEYIQKTDWIFFDDGSNNP